MSSPSVRVLRHALLIVLFVLWRGSGAFARTTSFVDPDGIGDFVDLQTAIDAASDGDLLALLATNYTGAALNITGKGLSIAAAGWTDIPAVTVASVRTPSPPSWSRPVRSAK
jgi:hypothetical protein